MNICINTLGESRTLSLSRQGKNLIVNGMVIKPFRHPDIIAGSWFSRAVYIVGNLVIKIDYKSRKHFQGKHELQFLEIVDDSDRHFFPEIYAYAEFRNGDFLIVQPYYELQKSRYPSPTVTMLIQRYSLYDVFSEYGENHNWAFCNGRELIFDFGGYENTRLI